MTIFNQTGDRFCIIFIAMAMSVTITADAYSQRLGGGGGSRPNIGGGGGARPNIGSGGGARPSINTGGARPSINTGGARPNISAGSRPNMGNTGVSMPNHSATRPGAGSLPSLSGTSRPNLPSASRPSLGGDRPATGVSRPAPVAPGGRPAVTLPGSFPSTTRPSLPNLGGGDRPISGIERPGGGTTRPSLPDRPTLGTRPTLPSRPPEGIDRPNITRPGGVNRPNLPDRPSIGTRPTFPDRPNIGIDRPTTPIRPDRPGYPDRPIIGGQRPVHPDRPIIGGGNNIIGGGNNIIGGGNNIGIGIGGGNTNININNRPNWGWNPGWGWNSNWGNHPWYNGHWNSHWGTTWYRPAPTFFVGWGLSSWVSYPTYVNPYFVPSTTAVYSYSQPIVINNSVAAAPLAADNPVDAASVDHDKALRWFDEGIAAFGDGDFNAALTKFDAAITKLPGDPVLHEMRALTYFALGKFQQSAAVLNALLATSPGMDWTTMSGLYGDVNRYTTQLRVLEEHVERNPQDAAGLFVLAYHYLVMGHKDDAIDLLKAVVAIQPQDGVASAMLASLVPPVVSLTNAPQSGATQAPLSDGSSAGGKESSPETDLVGNWLATNENVSIHLSIDEESRFTWLATPQDAAGASQSEPVKLQGNLLAAGNMVVLQTEASGAMTGVVESGGADRFIFTVAGGPPGDSGLDFNRQ